jgi:hypothetical protein
MIASGYRESLFTPVLNAVISRDEQVTPTWQIPVGPLPPAPDPDPELFQDSEVMASDAMDSEVDESQDLISLSDLRLRGSDAESVWIKLFSSAPKPYSKAILTLTGKALHEMTALEFDVGPLDELDIRSGSTIVIKARGKGGSSTQRSLEHFLPFSRPPDSTTPFRTQRSLKVLCWNCTSLGSFTQSTRPKGT